MKGRHNDLIIDLNEPFKECKLNRKRNAEILTEVVQRYKDGFVLAINNPWGAGKTTFVKMWQQHLENEHFRTVYFNAWENDLGNAIFPALLSELEGIDRAHRDGENQQNPRFADVLDKAAPIAKSLMPAVAKILFDRFAGKGAASELAEAIAAGGAEVLAEGIKDYRAQKQGLGEFKKSLTEFVETYTSYGRPIIFIIDELDRCRPDYAVSVLEHIKHLFSIRRVVFVLSIDKVQLGHAICGVYGSDNFDSNEYLRRFIDLEYNLPVPNYTEITKYFFNYFGFEDVALLKNKPNAWFSDEELFDFMGQRFRHLNWNIRRIEKLMARCRVTMSLVAPDEFHLMPFYLYLSFLYELDGEFAGKLTSGKLTITEVNSKLKSPELLFGASFEAPFWQKCFAFILLSISDNFTDISKLNPINAIKQQPLSAFSSVVHAGSYGQLSLPGIVEIGRRLRHSYSFEAA